MNPDSKMKRRASKASTSRPGLRATHVWASRAASAETGEPLAHSLDRVDAAARERRRRWRRALAFALLLHLLAGAGIVWIAGRRGVSEPPAIPIDRLFEVDAPQAGAAEPSSPAK